MIRPASNNIDITMPVVADYGILSRATTVKTIDTDWWLNGFTHSVADSGVQGEMLRILGSDPAIKLNVPAGGPAFLSYKPFMIRTSVHGSTFGSDLESFKKTANESLEVIQQKAIEQEFWEGELSTLEQTEAGVEAPTNRFLASTKAVDVTPTPATGVKARYGLALLEEAVGSRTIGYKGTIHAPRAVASALRVKDKDGVLTTNLGSSVIAGSGYSKQGPDGTDAGAGKYWMYATGPVTVILGDDIVIPDTLSQAINTRKNTVDYIAEKPAAVVWPTQDVFAVLVDLSLDYA